MINEQSIGVLVAVFIIGIFIGGIIMNKMHRNKAGTKAAE